MQGQYNMRSPAVKRLMKEAQELNEPTELYHAQPLEDNLFEWHFTLRGPEDSEFESGIYHGRIILPPDYPMKPPSIILLTPNGRFETFKKICLSISGHHPESWQPSWSIRTALLALIGFMPTHGGGAIGSLDYTPEERKVLAKKSQDWKCPDCGVVTDKLKPVTQESEKVSQEAKALASQINFQGEKKGASESNSEGQSTAASSPATPAAASSTPAPTSPPPASPLGPFPFPWAMPPGWNPSTAGASGGMAFPRFPYPPPFMMPAPGLGSAGRPGGQQQMPMFPPPLPFFPSMFPGFPPILGQPGAAVASSNATTVSSSQANTVGGGMMPSVASTSVTAAATTAAPPAVTTATPFASQPLSAPSTSNTTATETVGTSSVRPTTASTPQTSVAGPTPAATSTTGISSPQPATATSPTATSTTTGLRQRQTANSRPATTSAAQTTSPRSQTSQRVSLVLMLVVAFIIGLLLARRVYMQFYRPHYRGVMD